MKCEILGGFFDLGKFGGIHVTGNQKGKRDNTSEKFKTTASRRASRRKWERSVGSL
jgi:hypothetical protein